MPSNLTIAGIAGALIFTGATAATDSILDRLALAAVASSSGYIAALGSVADRRRTRQDEIASAIKRERSETERLQATLEVNHGVEIAKIRKDLQRQIESLHAEKLTLEAQYSTERSNIQRDYETRLNQAVSSHTSALQGSQTQHARTIASELRDRDERIDAMTREHIANTDRLHSEIGNLKAKLERAQLDRDELLSLDHARELHTLELQQKDDTIARLENQIAGLQSRLGEISEAIDAEFDQAMQSGFKEASEQYEKAIAEMERQHTHDLQALASKIGQLETQLDKRKSRNAFEQSLTTLETLLDNRLTPLLITGNQRAGKGTIGVEAARIYGGRSELGAVIIGFDPSEGGRETSTFGRAGIPSFSDPYLVLELMEAIEANKHSRPLTNEAQAKNTPRIVLAIDELGTCIDALNKESRTRFGELFKHTYQNWLKFGIVPILLGHSPQIQNLECGGIQLLNGGHAHTAFTNILVCDVIEKFAKDNGGMTDDLASYLQAYEGQFTSTYFKKGKLHPMKHASHHGKTWSDSVPPHDKSKVRLAPCPDWFPHAIRQLYVPYYESAIAEDRAGAAQCSQRVSISAVQPPDRSVGQEWHADPILQNWGQKSAELGFSEDELRALVGCIEAGKNQGESLKSALGIKSRSGNPESAYQRGRDLYRAIKTTLVTV